MLAACVTSLHFRETREISWVRSFIRVWVTPKKPHLTLCEKCSVDVWNLVCEPCNALYAIYNFLQRIWNCLQQQVLWFIKTILHKIYWDLHIYQWNQQFQFIPSGAHPSPLPFRSNVDSYCKHCTTQLQHDHKQHCSVEEGGRNYTFTWVVS
jgi:hypothetical protein